MSTSEKDTFKTQLATTTAEYGGNTQNTHKPQTNNSAALVVAKLHELYYKDVSSDQMLKAIDGVLRQWVYDDLVQFDIVKADDPETEKFLNELTEKAKTKNDGTDTVNTKDGEYFCRLWEVLYCLLRALKDDGAYSDPKFDYPARCRELHRIMVDIFRDGRCNTGMRNDFLKVLHRQFRFPDGQVVFIFTSVMADVNQMILDHYQDQLNRYLAEGNPLGMRMYFAWLEQESRELEGEEKRLLVEFRIRGIIELEAKILSYIEECNIQSGYAEKIMADAKSCFAFVNDLNCPTPTMRTPLFDAIREIWKDPGHYPAELPSLMRRWKTLDEINPMIQVLVRRQALLTKMEAERGKLPLGGLEGKLKSESIRLHAALTDFDVSMDADAAVQMKALHEMDDTYSQCLAAVRREDPRHALGDSFAMLMASHESVYEFRTLLHALMDRPECRVEEPALRTLLESLARIEEGYTVLDLRPETANSILWHAMRAPLGTWSEDFQTLIQLFIEETTKEGHDDKTKRWIASSFQPLEGQLVWMLECARSKTLTRPPEILVPCNLEGLSFHKNAIQNLNNFDDHFFVPLGGRGWWQGLPDVWYDEAWIVYNNELTIFRVIHFQSSDTQRAREFDRVSSLIFKKASFMHCIFPKLSTSLRSRIMIRHAHKMDHLDFASLLKNFNLQELEPLLPDLEKTLKSPEKLTHLASRLGRRSGRALLERHIACFSDLTYFTNSYSNEKFSMRLRVLGLLAVEELKRGNKNLEQHFESILSQICDPGLLILNLLRYQHGVLASFYESDAVKKLECKPWALGVLLEFMNAKDGFALAMHCMRTSSIFVSMTREILDSLNPLDPKKTNQLLRLILKYRGTVAETVIVNAIQFFPDPLISQIFYDQFNDFSQTMFPLMLDLYVQKHHGFATLNEFEPKITKPHQLSSYISRMNDYTVDFLPLFNRKLHLLAESSARKEFYQFLPRGLMKICFPIIVVQYLTLEDQNPEIFTHETNQSIRSHHILEIEWCESVISEIRLKKYEAQVGRIASHDLHRLMADIPAILVKELERTPVESRFKLAFEYLSLSADNFVQFSAIYPLLIDLTAEQTDRLIELFVRYFKYAYDSDTERAMRLSQFPSAMVVDILTQHTLALDSDFNYYWHSKVVKELFDIEANRGIASIFLQRVESRITNPHQLAFLVSVLPAHIDVLEVFKRRLYLLSNQENRKIFFDGLRGATKTTSPDSNFFEFPLLYRGTFFKSAQSNSPRCNRLAISCFEILIEYDYTVGFQKDQYLNLLSASELTEGIDIIHRIARLHGETPMTLSFKSKKSRFMRKNEKVLGFHTDDATLNPQQPQQSKSTDHDNSVSTLLDPREHGIILAADITQEVPEPYALALLVAMYEPYRRAMRGIGPPEPRGRRPL